MEDGLKLPLHLTLYATNYTRPVFSPQDLRFRHSPQPMLDNPSAESEPTISAEGRYLLCHLLQGGKCSKTAGGIVWGHGANKRRPKHCYLVAGHGGVIPARRRLKQEDHKLEASLGYIVKHYENKTRKQMTKKKKKTTMQTPQKIPKQANTLIIFNRRDHR